MVSLKVYLELFKAAVVARFLAVTLVALEGFAESKDRDKAIAVMAMVCIGLLVLAICFLLQLFNRCRSSIAPIVIIVGMVISALSAIVELALVAVIGFTQPQCWDDRMFGTTPKSLSLEKICSPVYAGYVGAFGCMLISLALIVTIVLIILICPPKEAEETQRMQQKTFVQPTRHRDSDSRRVQHSDKSKRQPSSRSTRDGHSQKQNSRSEKQHSNKSTKNASGRSSRSQKLNRFRI